MYWKPQDIILGTYEVTSDSSITERITLPARYRVKTITLEVIENNRGTLWANAYLSAYGQTLHNTEPVLELCSGYISLANFGQRLTAKPEAFLSHTRDGEILIIFVNKTSLDARVKATVSLEEWIDG